MIIEFITRAEGLHKVFVNVNDSLFNDSPFLVHVNGDLQTLSTVAVCNSPSLLYARSPSLNHLSTSNSSSNDHLAKSFSGHSLTSDSVNFYGSSGGVGTFLATNPFYLVSSCKIMVTKTNFIFHFLLPNKNIQGLGVYGNSSLFL